MVRGRWGSVVGVAAAWLLVVAVPAGAVTPVVDEVDAAFDGVVGSAGGVAGDVEPVVDGPALVEASGVDAEAGASSVPVEWAGVGGLPRLLDVGGEDVGSASDSLVVLRELGAGVFEGVPSAFDAGVEATESPVEGRAGAAEPDVPAIAVGAEVRASEVAVHGVIPGASLGLSLQQTESGVGASWVELALDPEVVEGAFGADYGSRVRWWAFPECAVERPWDVECVTGVPLPTRVDEATGEVVGVVPVDGLAVAGDVAAETDPSVAPVEGDEARVDGSGEPAASAGAESVVGVEGEAVVEGDDDGAAGTGSGDSEATSQELIAQWVDASAVAEPLASGGTIIAAISGASGQGGTFTATDLRASGEWTVGEGSGSFAYQVPFELPPASVGATPQLAVNYSSAAVDGRTLADNGQTSPVGEGWDMSTGYIERLYKPCAADGYAARAGDLCWYSPVSSEPAQAAYVLSLGGQTHPLVWAGENRYRTEQDSGWRITRHTDGPGNADNTNEYFKVMLPDGSRYLFGYGTLQDGTVTDSVAVVPVYGNDTGEPRCGAAASDYCVQGYRWMLDVAVDVNENATTYGYFKDSNRYASGGSPSRSLSYTSAIYLDQVRYGQPWPVTGTYEVLVDVARAYRCVQATGTDFSGLDDSADCPSPTTANAASYPDTPIDLICTSTCT